MTATPAQPAAPLSESDDRLWASLAHLGGVLGILPSLIIWLVFKDRGRFTDSEAKEALNFQILALIVYIAWAVISGILNVVTFGIFAVLSVPVSFALWIAVIVFSILGFVKAKDGTPYRYPVNLRLIK